MGRSTAPRIMGGSRSSGMTRPCFLSLRAKRVLVTKVMVRAPRMTPMRIPRKGRAPTPWFQPRCSWKEMGYASKKR